MSDVLTEICGLLVQGIQSFGSGLASGINSLVSGLFIDSTGTTQKLSVFGGCIVIFGSIALCVGISRFIVRWLTSWGN